ERLGLEAVVADLDHMAQRAAIKCLREQLEKAAEIGLVEFLVRRELPEQGAEAGPQLRQARVEEALDRIAGLFERAPIDRITRTFQRKNKSLGHLGRPFAKRRRVLGPVEGAVDLDRGQVFGGIAKLARMRQAFGIE